MAKFPPSEQIGRTNLFTGAYMAFRNRRAHQEPDPNNTDALQEFLLINHLYNLEQQAVLKVENLDT
jgi:hypothetical protein